MAEIVPDTRPDFIAEYTQKSLRLKPERWVKFLQSDEHKKILQDFLDKSDPAQIVIGQNAAGQLSVSTSFPTGGSKSKSIFFMKRTPGPIPKEKDIKSCLVFGDLSPTPLDQLTSLIEHVIIPLLSVKENHEGWPKVVSEDINGQVLDLKGTVHRVLGQLDGKTLLPLPIDADKIAAAEAVAKKDPSKVDYELKASLEKLVTKWSSQIQEVLVRDSGAELEAGNHPTPMSVRIVEDNRGNQVVETIMYRLPGCIKKFQNLFLS